MSTHLENTLLIATLGTLLLAGCSGGGDDPDPVNEGSYTTDDFNYVSPHGPHHQALSETVTAILSHKEIASLHPTGTGQNRVIDFDDGSPEFPGDFTFPGGFEFEHAASGQIDSDPEEDFLVARFYPPAGGGQGSLEVTSLERDGSWLERFQLEVGDNPPLAFATGDVDGDGLDEVIVAWDDSQGVWASVLRDGLLLQEIPVFASYADLDLERLELELADLDADGRDEIVLLGNRGPYWEAPYSERRVPVLEILDDAQAAHQRLAQYEVGVFAHADLHEGGPAQLIVGDFDRFHVGEEICLARLVYPALMLANSPNLQYESFAYFEDAAELQRCRRGALDLDTPHLILMPYGNLGEAGVAPPADGLVGFEAVAADLDGDGSEELVTTCFTRGAGGSSDCPSSAGHFLVFNLPLDLTPEEIQERWSVPDQEPANLPPEFPSVWDFTANFQRVGSYAVLGAKHDPVAKTATMCSGWPDFEASRWSLVAGDQDADARDELHVSGSDGHYLGNPPVFHSAVEAEWEGGRFSLTESWYIRFLMSSSPPRLLNADWDCDDFRLKYTGNKKLAVGTPLPLVLMGAPPTKAGVSQNYQASQTVFETSVGTEKVYSVTTGISAGVWAGYDVSDPFGIFGASGRVKFEVELAMTETSSVGVRKSDSYSTAHDQDVIIFQGTLYESYEYEVVAAEDPSAIGEFMTIDVPVDTKVYKWTLDFYNASVAPEHVIGPEVLDHTVGDPASYMRQQDAKHLVGEDQAYVSGESYVGWVSGSRSLGQSGGSNGVTIEIAEQTSSATKVGWSVTAEQEFKAGAFVAGFSVGLLQDYVYEVSVSRTTRYHGEIGDISNWSEYQAWNYDFGLVTYTKGLFSDADNDPQEVEAGTIPYQIETYYTAPVGSGYIDGGGQ